MDPVNPTAQELRVWARSDDPWPMQDWDVVLADESTGPLLMELVEDGGRPDFFLCCLYILAGDAVRTRYHATSRGGLQQLVERGAGSSDESLRRWADRTARLMSDPTDFEYEAWCQGGLVRQDSTGT